ncbi:MAG TPA: WD40 repeat domain-containing protein, partial [Gemmataceae bacterium]|nr:WD40 repeat domain-containing protein [Gemmataceae bacterium]
MPRLVFAVLVLFLCNSWGVAQEFPNLPSGSPGTGVDAQGDPLPHGARARLGSTRFRLGGTVTAAALSLDGKWIVSGNNSDVLTLSDPKSGKEISRLRIPGGYGASFLTFSPDSRNIAVMGYAPFLQIVAIPSGKLVSKLQVPQPNNSRLTGFAFSGDGMIIVAGTDNFGQNKNFVHAWEVATGKPLHNFEVVQNAQIRGALSNNGAVLATSGYYNPRTGMENNPDQGRTIQLWDVHTGAELRKVKIDNNPIMAVALSQDGKTFAVASGSATFHLFETESGKELRRFAGRRGHVQFLQFAPDGKTLVAGSADGTVQRWEADTGKRLGLTDGPRQRLFGIAFPSPGQVWALGMDGQALALWDAVTDRQLSPSDGHMTWVRFLAYAADGKTLLTGGADGKICWWDTATARELRHHFIRDEDSYRYGGYPPAARFSNYALSRDGKYLAVASDHGQNTIRLFDMTSGKVLCDFDAARTGSPSAFAFSPDNTRLAAMGLKGVHLWDVTTGQELTSLPFKVDP